MKFTEVGSVGAGLGGPIRIVRADETQLYCKLDELQDLMQSSDTVFAPPGEYHLTQPVTFIIEPICLTNNRYSIISLDEQANDCVLGGAIDELHINSGDVSSVTLLNAYVGDITVGPDVIMHQIKVKGTLKSDGQLPPDVEALLLIEQPFTYGN